MRASTFVFAFAASAFAAGVDSTDKFNDITAPIAEKAVADSKSHNSFVFLHPILTIN
jgi:hypothetical protein